MGANITISKRQKGIIWGTVIIIVLLIGLTSSQKTYTYTPKYSFDKNVVTVQLTHLFGIEVGRKYVGTDDFFYYAVKNKISEIIAVALIGFAAFITSKKK